MPKALRISCCVYRFLLDFYPREFRQRFGVEMMQVFAEQMAEEWKRHGIGGAVRVGLTAGWEVISVAAPLQLYNSIVIAAALSVISSSALFLALFRAVSR
ncbi:MAG TPA: hypothetical protein VK302_15545 [Terriglobales bacterium]|nr:hypothetical protein [Terriglobales bacterium]